MPMAYDGYGYSSVSGGKRDSGVGGVGVVAIRARFGVSQAFKLHQFFDCQAFGVVQVNYRKLLRAANCSCQFGQSVSTASAGQRSET